MYANKEYINQSINQSIENQGLQDYNLIEKNYIWTGTTQFYIDISTNPIQYGVYINIQDQDKALEIIQRVKKDRKRQIEAWNEEQHKINIESMTKQNT